MVWRVARSLDTLLGQINEVAPNRSKTSDGSIGDVEHSSRESDHNPDSRGIVHARDFTDDPAGGCNIDAIFRSLTVSNDYRIKYLIRQFHGAGSTITQWQSGRLVWVPYYGTNPHDKHGHISVNTTGEDDTRSWSIGGTTRGDDELSAQFEKDMTDWTRMRDARDRQLEKDLRADLAWKAKQIEALQADVAKIVTATA